MHMHIHMRIYTRSAAEAARARREAAEAAEAMAAAETEETKLVLPGGRRLPFTPGGKLPTLTLVSDI